ncbi:MAG: hypothetical protein HYT12_04505 [Candidatus Liptonbacteria bacterium]|nr:hypothetical protein [Candidatus Liptonbacteria bacterium]
MRLSKREIDFVKKYLHFLLKNSWPTSEAKISLLAKGFFGTDDAMEKFIAKLKLLGFVE